MIDPYNPNHYRFSRSLPAGSLPLRRFSVRPYEAAQESSGWSMFGAGMVCGALILAACLAVA